MKKLLGALIVAVGLMGCATLNQHEATEEFAWTEMCTLVQSIEDVSPGDFYTCEGVLPPLTVYEYMREGLYGYYDGSDTIFVSTEIARGEVIAVLLHEMIHYLHVQLELIEVPGYAEEICWSEDQAWGLEGIWSGVDNSEWWIAYSHCWPYYGTPEYVQAAIVIDMLEDWFDDIIDEIIENLEN